jgi:2-amino-4-hydroxy-6-hydroxymethyldihydropteridine diphosphokinase
LSRRTRPPRRLSTTRSSPSGKDRASRPATRRAKTTTDGPVEVAIGLGGNVGSPELAFGRALEGLAARVGRLAVSPLYVTAPVGGPPQPDFLNAAATFRTSLSPLELLALLRRLETEAGRERLGERYGPRPLDLDILLYGDLEIDIPGLVIPHPRLAERRFVLAPLADLVPDLVVPGTGRTVASLLASAPEARVERRTTPEDRASGRPVAAGR